MKDEDKIELVSFVVDNSRIVTTFKDLVHLELEAKLKEIGFNGDCYYDVIGDDMLGIKYVIAYVKK